MHKDSCSEVIKLILYYLQNYMQAEDKEEKMYHAVSCTDFFSDQFLHSCCLQFVEKKNILN